MAGAAASVATALYQRPVATIASQFGGIPRTLPEPMLPALGIEWQPRELAINALSALTALVTAMTAPIWGRVSDRIGRRRVIVTGLVGYSAGLLLFNLAAELGRAAILSGLGLYLALIVARVLYACVMSAVGPASAAYMADITSPAQRAAGVGRLNSANQIGVMMGPALIFFAFISLLAPIYLLATLMGLMALLVWRLLPEGAPRLTHAQPSVRLGFFDPRYRRFMLTGMTIYAMIGLAQPTRAFYFQDKLHLDGVTTAQRYSLAMMISSGAMVFTPARGGAAHPLEPGAAAEAGAAGDGGWLCADGAGHRHRTPVGGDGLFRRRHGHHGAGVQRRRQPQRRPPRAGRAGGAAGVGGIAGLSVRPAAGRLPVRTGAGAAVLGRGAGAVAADVVHLAAAALKAHFRACNRSADG